MSECHCCVRHCIRYKCKAVRGIPSGASGEQLTYQCRRHATWAQSLGWEDPLEEGMETHSSILAWRIPVDREAWPATVPGPQRVGHDCVTKHSTTLLVQWITYLGNSFTSQKVSKTCLVKTTYVNSLWRYPIWKSRESVEKSNPIFFPLVWAPKEARELHLRTIEWETKV